MGRLAAAELGLLQGMWRFTDASVAGLCKASRNEKQKSYRLLSLALCGAN
jgi:hypothetical protein